MRIHHWETDHGNFGDDLNLFLWPHFLPGLIDDDPDTLLVGVGTVLNDEVPPARRRIVMGSGIGYGRLPENLGTDPSWDIRAVRGPLSARVLGRPELAAADPAVLLPLMPDFPEMPRHGTVFVPHWTTAAAGGWQEACARAGIEFLDPRGEARSVIRRIASAEKVIAESMHGVIVADAFRTPWVAVVTGRDTPFKWHDWAGALGLAYEPLFLGGLDNPALVAKARLRGTRPVLRRGDAGVVEAAYQGYMSRYSARPDVIRAPGWRERLRPAINAALALTQTPKSIAAHGAAMLEQAMRHTASLSTDAALATGQQKLLERIAQLQRDMAPA